MSNYKLEVRKQYGTFKALFHDVQATAEETDHATLDDVVASVKAAAEKLDFDVDSIIFRGIAYTSGEAVARQVKVAVY